MLKFFEEVNVLNFEELKKKFPMLTEEKFKALLAGKRDILLEKTEDCEVYYTLHNEKLINTKFVDKKKSKISIVLKDDLI